jgi:hypothetical protein
MAKAPGRQKKRAKEDGNGLGGWERLKKTAKNGTGRPRWPGRAAKGTERHKRARAWQMARPCRDAHPSAPTGTNGCRRRREAETGENGTARGRNSTKRVKTAPRVAQTAQNG